MVQHRALCRDCRKDLLAAKAADLDRQCGLGHRCSRCGRESLRGSEMAISKGRVMTECRACKSKRARRSESRLRHDQPASGPSWRTVPNPEPARDLREQLRRDRARGKPFDQAWHGDKDEPGALEWVLGSISNTEMRESWAEALKWSKWAWRNAYQPSEFAVTPLSEDLIEEIEPDSVPEAAGVPARLNSVRPAITKKDGSSPRAKGFGGCPENLGSTHRGNKQ